MDNARKPLRRINQNVPEDLYGRLAATAVREDRTKSAVLIRALEAYIGVSERTAHLRRGGTGISLASRALVREASSTTHTRQIAGCWQLIP